MDNQKMKFEAGDLVLVRCEHWLKKEQIDQMEAMIREKIPSASNVLILPGDIHIEFVTTPQVAK